MSGRGVWEADVVSEAQPCQRPAHVKVYLQIYPSTECCPCVWQHWNLTRERKRQAQTFVIPSCDFVSKANIVLRNAAFPLNKDKVHR